MTTTTTTTKTETSQSYRYPRLRGDGLTCRARAGADHDREYPIYLGSRGYTTQKKYGPSRVGTLVLSMPWVIGASSQDVAEAVHRALHRALHYVDIRTPGWTSRAFDPPASMAEHAKAKSTAIFDCERNLDAARARVVRLQRCLVDLLAARTIAGLIKDIRASASVGRANRDHKDCVSNECWVRMIENALRYPDTSGPEMATIAQQVMRLVAGSGIPGSGDAARVLCAVASGETLRGWPDIMGIMVLGRPDRVTAVELDAFDCDLRDAHADLADARLRLDKAKSWEWDRARWDDWYHTYCAVDGDGTQMEDAPESDDA